MSLKTYLMQISFDKAEELKPRTFVEKVSTTDASLAIPELTTWKRATENSANLGDHGELLE